MKNFQFEYKYWKSFVSLKLKSSRLQLQFQPIYLQTSNLFKISSRTTTKRNTITIRCQHLGVFFLQDLKFISSSLSTTFETGGNSNTVLVVSPGGDDGTTGATSTPLPSSSSLVLYILVAVGVVAVIIAAVTGIIFYKK